ncbi:TRAP transporter small permease [Burkholderiaceae bacterium FT117]|uniref:TRAP transporter small permease subunit n=1 Tax=Zeimonas sediminis TaxID=2944268 RepID=UPI002342C3F3|nr:TRAP transporter small permease [Zeimonas sediminis]MCM5569906.1 TRAP transporter small permease [Zeimonas sediminis]
MKANAGLAIFHRLLSALNLLGAVWVVLIMLLITADVIGRAFFDSPLFGVPEIVKISVVGLVWCMMPHTLKIGAHLRSTILLDRMPAGAQRAVEVLSCLLGVAIFALIVYSGWDQMIEAWKVGEFEGEDPVRVPTYPIRSLVVLGAALTALQFLVMLAGHLRGKPFGQPGEKA